MASAIGPRVAELRAMRERQHAERLKLVTQTAPVRPAAKAAKIAKAKAAVKASRPSVDSVDKQPSGDLSTLSTPAEDSDRKAYQREWARKRRAAAKAT